MGQFFEKFSTSNWISLLGENISYSFMFLFYLALVFFYKDILNNDGLKEVE
jgi:hypothetical protein